MLRFEDLRSNQDSEESRQMVRDIQRLFDEYKSTVVDPNSKGSISTYARKNIEEFIAESFAQAELSSAPSYYAVEIMKILNKYFAWNEGSNFGELRSRWREMPSDPGKSSCVIC